MAHRKGYIFTNKRHPQKAVMATILGVISTVSLTAVVFLSYRRQGGAPAGYGFAGLLVTLYSAAGLALSISAVRDKNSYRLFPWLGVLLNLLALAGISLVLYVGAL